MIAPSYTKKVTDLSELFVGRGYLLKPLILCQPFSRIEKTKCTNNRTASVLLIIPHSQMYMRMISKNAFRVLKSELPNIRTKL